MSSPAAKKLTLGQELGVRHVGETLQALYPRPCSVATVRRELRRARPCNDLQQSKTVLFTEGRNAVKASVDGVLSGYGALTGTHFV